MQRDVEMTFGEHLEELRRRILLALVGIVVGAGICGIFHSELFNFLADPYESASKSLADRIERPYRQGAGRQASSALRDLATGGRPVEPAGGAAAEIPDDVRIAIEKFRHPRIIPGGPATLFTTIIVLCLAAGAVIASPWVIYQVWAFVGVGLYPRERRRVYVYGPVSFLLFVGGAVFSFFALRLAMEALLAIGLHYRVIENVYTLDAYVRFIAWMVLAFGLAFQTPLVVLFLARTGIVPLSTLVRQQRIVILLMCILAAVLTPGTDAVSMASLGIPLIVLYQVGLLLAWISDRRGGKRREEPA